MVLDGSIIPEWHLKIIASAVRCMRSKNCRYSARIEVEPSCRATIKAFDHVVASALRNGRKAVMLADYGKDYSNLSLALKSRFEVDYEDELSKDDIVRGVVEDSIDRVCGEVYAAIPRSIFGGIMEELSEMGEINVYAENGLKNFKNLWAFLSSISRRKEEVNSAFEITLEAIGRCTGLVEKVGEGTYVYTSYDR
jgi:magnesium chelatase subunit I